MKSISMGHKMGAGGGKEDKKIKNHLVLPLVLNT